MKYLALILTVVISSTVFGQSYYKSEIAFSNGTTKFGYAKVPDGNQKKVAFKNTLDEKSINIESDDIFTITFKLEDGSSHTLERSVTKMIATKKNGEIYSKIYKKKGWFFRNYSNEKLNFYSAGQKYKITKKGVFKITSTGQTGFAGIGYYFKRPNENEVTYITAKMGGIQIFEEKMFRNAATTYLSDNKDLASRIENKEFKSKQILDIYNIYISVK